MESKGVIYYNRGEANLVRLVVSMMTLRRHYSGDVTVFLDEKHPDGLPEQIKDTFGANVIYRPDIKLNVGTFVRKVEVSKDAPYGMSVFIDSDTVVVGSFDELFDMTSGCDLVVTPYAGYKSSCKLNRRRMEGFRGKCPQYLRAARQYGYMINMGVYAWMKGSAIFEEWMDLTRWGDKKKLWIFDEIACQILLPRYKIRMAPSKFNVIADKMDKSEDDRIIHYCGRQHLGDYPLCEIWRKAFTEALRENVCGIRGLAEWHNETEEEN
jgi:hypothetical protein